MPREAREVQTGAAVLLEGSSRSSESSGSSLMSVISEVVLVVFEDACGWSVWLLFRMFVRLGETPGLGIMLEKRSLFREEILVSCSDRTHRGHVGR